MASGYGRFTDPAFSPYAGRRGHGGNSLGRAASDRSPSRGRRGHGLRPDYGATGYTAPWSGKAVILDCHAGQPGQRSPVPSRLTCRSGLAHNSRRRAPAEGRILGAGGDPALRPGCCRNRRTASARRHRRPTPATCRRGRWRSGRPVDPRPHWRRHDTTESGTQPLARRLSSWRHRDPPDAGTGITPRRMEDRS